MATIYSARLAGFECPVALIEEPLAAFIHFHSNGAIKMDTIKKGRHVLVFDFGGGTCDLSLIGYKFGKPTVIKSDTIRVGGSLLDKAIVAWWLEREGMPYKSKRTSSDFNHGLTVLHDKAEELKIELSKKLERYLQNGSLPDSTD